MPSQMTHQHFWRKRTAENVLGRMGIRESILAKQAITAAMTSILKKTKIHDSQRADFGGASDLWA